MQERFAYRIEVVRIDAVVNVSLPERSERGKQAIGVVQRGDDHGERCRELDSLRVHVDAVEEPRRARVAAIGTQGRRAEAQPLLGGAYEVLLAQRGPSDRATREARARLGLR